MEMFGFYERLFRMEVKEKKTATIFSCIAIALPFLLILAMPLNNAVGESSLTYQELQKQGIVSGFGVRSGDPLRNVNRIPAISNPQYLKVEKGLYASSELCIGTETARGWRFSPIYILNSHEIVNLNNSGSLCFCPLAGLAVATAEKLVISGLLKYDTFVLYRRKDQKLILPFTQEVIGDPQQTLSFHGIHMLTYDGILKHFPEALILDPSVYRGRKNAYGDYPIDSRMGIGHPKPGLTKPFNRRKEGYHSKEKVLVIGLNGNLSKAYPFSELKKNISSSGGFVNDVVDGVNVIIHYFPQYQWAYAKNSKGDLLNLAYSYIFSLKQHLPDIEIYRSRPSNGAEFNNQFLEDFQHASSIKSLKGWEPIEFPNISRHSTFSIQKEGNNSFLQVSSHHACSGLLRSLTLTPKQSVSLQWLWRVDQLPNKTNEADKESDDFPLRVMVLFEQPSAQKKGITMPGFKGKIGSALCYVWANFMNKEEIVPSPLSEKIAIISVESGNTHLGHWKKEIRNITKDYQKAFEDPTPKIIGIAIIADTDDTASSTMAAIDDITFEER